MRSRADSVSGTPAPVAFSGHQSRRTREFAPALSRHCRTAAAILHVAGASLRDSAVLVACLLALKRPCHLPPLSSPAAPALHMWKRQSHWMGAEARQPFWSVAGPVLFLSLTGAFTALLHQEPVCKTLQPAAPQAFHSHIPPVWPGVRLQAGGPALTKAGHSRTGQEPLEKTQHWLFSFIFCCLSLDKPSPPPLKQP